MSKASLIHTKSTFKNCMYHQDFRTVTGHLCYLLYICLRDVYKLPTVACSKWL